MSLFLNILAVLILFEAAMLIMALFIGNGYSFWEDFFAAHIVTGCVAALIGVGLIVIWAINRLETIT